MSYLRDLCTVLNPKGSLMSLGSTCVFPVDCASWFALDMILWHNTGLDMDLLLLPIKNGEHLWRFGLKLVPVSLLSSLCVGLKSSAKKKVSKDVKRRAYYEKPSERKQRAARKSVKRVETGPRATKRSWAFAWNTKFKKTKLSNGSFVFCYARI